MMKRYRRFADEPNMSDKTLLLSVEDLICRAFGTNSKNVVNFKLLQTILYILARQMRLLEQGVEIKFDDIGIDYKTGKPYYDSDEYSDDSYDSYSDDESYSRRSSPRTEKEGGRGAIKERSKKTGEKERDEKEEEKERGEKAVKGGKKELGERGEKKERGEKGIKKYRREKEEKEEREDNGERGEKKMKRTKDRKIGSKDRESSSPDGRIDEDDAEVKRRVGRAKQHGGRLKRGEDYEDEGREIVGHEKRHGGQRRGGEADKDEGEERDGHGRRHGGQKRRGEDNRDEGGKSVGHEKRYTGQRRRGEDDEDEGGERDGYRRRHSGQRRRGEDERDEDEKREDRRQERSRDADREDRRYGERRGDNERDDRGRRRGVGKEVSGTSITVTEGPRRGGGGATVLIAERGPMTRGRVARVGSIEVVTASQFALMARAVKQLEQVTGPLPVPELPDNEQLREDVLHGRASLSDTMEAVQLNARVQAAEEGLSRMAGLLTQLTAAGALPMDFASRIGDLHAELRKSSMPPARSNMEPRGFPFGPRPGSRAVSTRFVEDAEYDEAEADTESQKDKGPDLKLEGLIKRTSRVSGAPAGTAGDEELPSYEDMPVTHNEMQDILGQMKEALTKEIQGMIARANHSADIASNTSRNVSEKLAIALTIDDRISTLSSQTADYAEQLHGFDTGLATQMASFQEQMEMMRSDLKGGLELLETANNNAETAAVLDLTQRYETLVLELNGTVHLHTNLNLVQRRIVDEQKTLLECVEMLREQKADRDEVLDCLRDKVDLARLAGLLHEKDFAQARFEIEKRIEKSYDKFYKQDRQWEIAMRDLTRTADHKAELVALIAFKDKATEKLNKIQEKQHQLEIMLGEPKAALLTRQLAKNASCGACLTPAVMPLTDATHGKPAPLPALRPEPLGAEDPCLVDVTLRPPETRRHTCHRWVGGSHTLMAGNMSRERAAQPHLETIPTKKYEEYGTDGRLYMMEGDLLPCAECNKFSADDADGLHPRSSTPTGGGDRSYGPVGSKHGSAPGSDHA